MLCILLRPEVPISNVLDDTFHVIVLVTTDVSEPLSLRRPMEVSIGESALLLLEKRHEALGSNRAHLVHRCCHQNQIKKGNQRHCMTINQPCIAGLRCWHSLQSPGHSFPDRYCAHRREPVHKQKVLDPAARKQHCFMPSLLTMLFSFHYFSLSPSLPLAHYQYSA
jgi:hypothetical protein